MHYTVFALGLSFFIGCWAPKNIYDFSATTIEGKEQSLSDYEDQVLLVVNVASECRLTPQYTELQKLHDMFQARGFSVIGFPCNQFGGQEPGSSKEIRTFCTSSFGITFPLFSKIEVNGENRHALYDYLVGSEATFPGDISWNFEKFVTDASGQVINRFGPSTSPTQREVIAAVESALEHSNSVKMD